MQADIERLCGKATFESLNLAIKLFDLSGDTDLGEKSRSSLLSQAVDTLNIHIAACLELQSRGLEECTRSSNAYKQSMDKKYHTVKAPSGVASADRALSVDKVIKHTDRVSSVDKSKDPQSVVSSNNESSSEEEAEDKSPVKPSGARHGTKKQFR